MILGVVIDPPRPHTLALSEASPATRCQVIPDYFGATQVAQGPVEVDAARRQWAKKAALWCKRKATDAEDETKVAPKKRRRASFQVGLAVDGLLRKVVGVGMDHFQAPDIGSEAYLRPEAWPHLSLAMDQGSDNVALTFFLRYAQKVNCEVWWDISHGVWRDVDLTVGEVGLRPFVRLATIGLNLGHGPWEDGSRYWQLVQGMQEYFSIADHQDPLFQAMLPKLISDLGVDDAGASEDIEVQVWGQLQQLWQQRTKGEKVALCRFAKFTDVAEQKDPLFHMTLLGALYVGLQEDMFDASTFQLAIDKKALTAPGSGEGSSSSVRRGNDCVNALRAACKNNLHTMVLVWSDPLTQPRLRVMFRFTRHVRAWYGDQSHRLRSCEAAAEWVVAQVGGLLAEPLNQTLMCLSDASDLEFVGLSVSELGKFAGKGMSEVFLHGQGQIAQLVGGWSMRLVANRIKRMLWFTEGWAGRQALLIASEEADRRQACRRFEEQHKAFEAARGKAMPIWRRMVERSFFQTGAVLQLALSLQKAGWQSTAEVQDLVRNRLSGILQSKISEDMVCRARRGEQHRQNSEMSDRAVWLSLVEHEVATSVHHFRELDCSGVLVPPSSSENTALQQRLFENKAKECTPMLKSIIGTRDKTDWYSSSVAGANLVFADTLLMEDAWRRQDWTRAASAWIAAFLPCGLLFREIASGQWFFSLGPIAGVIVCAWPARVVFHAKKLVAARPATPGKPHFLVATSFDHFEACSVAWTSPAEQSALGFEAFCRLEWSPGLVARPLAQPRTLLAEAAHQAFWDLGAMQLGKLASHRGVDFESGLSLCEKATLLMKDILKKASDVDIVEMLRQRLKSDDMFSWFSQLDDVEELVAKEDAKDFAKEKEDLAKGMLANARFSAEWQKLKAAVVAKQARGTRSGRTSAVTRAGGGKYPSEYPGGPMTHAQALQFVPPGAKFYEDKVNGRWQVLFKQQTRSRAWMCYGRDEACRLTLAEAWRMYLFDACLPESSCPIAKLILTEPADKRVARQSASGASSSVA